MPQARQKDSASVVIRGGSDVGGNKQIYGSGLNGGDQLTYLRCQNEMEDVYARTAQGSAAATYLSTFTTICDSIQDTCGRRTKDAVSIEGPVVLAAATPRMAEKITIEVETS